MALTGKGMMIWKIPSCEGGNAAQIANVAKAGGFTHILIKIADGTYSYNVDRATKIDLVPPVVAALKAAGIQVWGWHYIYGDLPAAEAQTAVRRTLSLGLDGYVIDAEKEFKQPGKDTAARTYMTELRRGMPNMPVALCSYRFPALHREFPWKAFLDKSDFNMPQVYWQEAHNPDKQMERCVKEFKALSPSRPIMPTGPLYPAGGWSATASELVLFMDTCKRLGIPAVNYFTWDYRNRLSSQWNAIYGYKWGNDSVSQDVPALYIAALNTRNPDNCVALYTKNAIRINAARIAQGADSLRAYFSNLFTTVLPNATFQLTGITGKNFSRRFTWTATSSNGAVRNGSDTIGIVNGRIGYHYSFFTLS